MRMAQYSLSLMLIMAAAGALLGPAIEANRPPDNLRAATLALNCDQVAGINWAEMNHLQRQLADVCDSAEANRNWQLAYGRMNADELLKGMVHDPL